MKEHIMTSFSLLCKLQSLSVRHAGVIIFFNHALIWRVKLEWVIHAKHCMFKNMCKSNLNTNFEFL